MEGDEMMERKFVDVEKLLKRKSGGGKCGERKV